MRCSLFEFCRVLNATRGLEFCSDQLPQLKHPQWGEFLLDSLPRWCWNLRVSTVPIGSMYGIYTDIWLIFMVNVGKYTIHGWYGVVSSMQTYLPKAWTMTLKHEPFGTLREPSWQIFDFPVTDGSLVRARSINRRLPFYGTFQTCEFA